MQYRERRSGLLEATLWTKTTDGTSGWILPDGCLDVLWDGRELTVAGPDTAAWLSATPTSTPYAAVRFDSGVGPAVLGTGADAVRDQRVPLADLLPLSEVEPVAEAVGTTRNPVRVLERWAAARLATGPGPDAAMRHVALLVDGGLRITEVARTVGLSERQLHRRSLTAFGYGPKTLARVQRLQRALALAHGGLGLALTAADAGYADQAHLAREVRALAGRPITAVLGAD